MADTTKHDTLAAAQLAVMEAVPYLQKRKGPGLNYTFAGEADLLAKLRPEMIRHGISIAPVGVHHVESERYTTSKGSAQVLIVGVFTFRFSHRDSKGFLDVQVFGEAADSGDKRAAKAQTIAYKYALRQFFAIETGDDPDADQKKRRPVTPDEFTRYLGALRGAKSMETVTKAQEWLSANSHLMDADKVHEFYSAIEERTEKLGATNG